MAKKTTTKAPAELKDGTITRWASFPGADEVVVVEPITWEWVMIGSRCWQAQITGGRLRCHRSYYVEYFDAQGMAEFREKQLRPPAIKIRWLRDPRIQAGCAGHTIDGRFLLPNEKVTEAGRIVIVE